MTNNLNYRIVALKAFSRAKSELASGDDDRVRYSALELRLVIEALTYERAKTLRDDIPESEYRTWQPSKLVDVILEIDPKFGMPVTVSIGQEDEPGVEAKSLQLFGSETPITREDIRENYHALGSFLHLDSVWKQKPDRVEKMRQRCRDLVELLDPILASEIWNVTFSRRVTFECANPSCNEKVRRRYRDDLSVTDAKCSSCGCEYALRWTEDGGCEVNPQMMHLNCATCDAGFAIFRHRFKEGISWSCKNCGNKNVVSYCVVQIPRTEAASHL